MPSRIASLLYKLPPRKKKPVPLTGPRILQERSETQGAASKMGRSGGV